MPEHGSPALGGRLVTMLIGHWIIESVCLGDGAIFHPLQGSSHGALLAPSLCQAG